MAQRVARIPPSPTKILAHRVHAQGAATHTPHHHSDGHDPKDAHAAAKAASEAHPLVRFEVRQVPSHLLTGHGKWEVNQGNEHGLHEQTVAIYQDDKQIPIT